jgi:CubicO group peptidase (beta-lactamase class C family)
VTKEGTVAIGATGQRARGTDDPVSIHDRWHLGSCTKAMTATLVAIFIEEGRLSWSTTLGDVYPEEVAAQPAWRPVTIEQLLRHRGGLPGDRHNAPWNRRREGTLPEQRRHVARSLLAEPPESMLSTATVYANAGYVLAGSILEMRTDDAWEDLMRQRLFEPLGMKSAGFGPPQPLPQPQGHRGRVPMGIGPGADNAPVLGPAGTVHASLEDWGRFVALHLTGALEGSELLSRESLARLHEPAPGSEYAMGWGSMERKWGGRVITHSGSNGSWYAVVWIAPEKGFAVLAATNEAGDASARGTDEVAAALIQHYQASKAPS